MTTTAMTVVQHPSLSVKYSVPEADASRWEAQGWKRTGDTPSVLTPAASDAPKLTRAQELGIGLLPVADGEPTPEPTTTEPEAAVDPKLEPEPDVTAAQEPTPEADPNQ